MTGGIHEQLVVRYRPDNAVLDQAFYLDHVRLWKGEVKVRQTIFRLCFTLFLDHVILTSEPLHLAVPGHRGGSDRWTDTGGSEIRD